MVVAVVASLGAALLYAVASVLQHRAARQAPPETSMRLGLLAMLIAKPWWVAGIVADVAAFALQFVALAHGPLVVVQPLLVAGLVFALPLGAWVQGTRVHSSEIGGAAVVAAALAVLLVVANPGHGRTDLPAAAWAGVIGATLVPVAVLIFAARRWTDARPPLLATATGLIYALTAALAKASADAFSHGALHTLAVWQTYALIPGGVVGMVVCQSAFQAGPLKASLPTLTAADPLASILIGLVAFNERIDHAPLHVVAVVAATAAMLGGVFVLARSPLVALEDEEVSPALPG